MRYQVCGTATATRFINADSPAEALRKWRKWQQRFGEQAIDGALVVIDAAEPVVCDDEGFRVRVKHPKADRNPRGLTVK